MGVSVVGGKKLRLEVSCEGDSKVRRGAVRGEGKTGCNGISVYVQGARALWTHASLTRESQYRCTERVWCRIAYAYARVGMDDADIVDVCLRLSRSLGIFVRL